MNMAIAWCELMISPNCFDGRDKWDRLREIGIDDALKIIRKTIQEDIDAGTRGKHAECLAATNTKEFRDYLAGKLGLM